LRVTASREHVGASLVIPPSEDRQGKDLQSKIEILLGELGELGG
jgi:hypothetical protein